MRWLGFLIIMGVGCVVVVSLIVWGIPANEQRLAARAQMDLKPDERPDETRDDFWGTTIEPAEYASNDMSEESEGQPEDWYNRWAAFTDEELAALEGALDAVQVRAPVDRSPAGEASLADEISAEIAQRAEDA